MKDLSSLYVIHNRKHLFRNKWLKWWAGCSWAQKLYIAKSIRIYVECAISDISHSIQATIRHLIPLPPPPFQTQIWAPGVWCGALLFCSLALHWVSHGHLQAGSENEAFAGRAVIAGSAELPRQCCKDGFLPRLWLNKSVMELHGSGFKRLLLIFFFLFFYLPSKVKLGNHGKSLAKGVS